MRRHTLTALAALILVSPALTRAQNVGFRVGTATPQPGGPIVRVATPVNPYAGGYYPYNPYAIPFQGVAINPYTGYGIYNTNPYNGLPPGGYIAPPPGYGPRGGVLNSGTVIIVGPRGQKVAPGYETAVPGRPPRGTGRNPRGQPAAVNDPTPRHGHPAGPAPGPPVLTPSGSGTFPRASRGDTPSGSNPAVPGIGVGSTRADVIARFGRPTVSMADRNGEALVFGGTTFLIQNGVVTRIHSR